MERKRKITWESPEYIYKEKSQDWFWALGIIAFSSSVASFILGNVLFGILIIMSAFILALHANKEPRIIKVELEESGIKIDKKYYTYNILESFGINLDNKEEPVLLFKAEKVFIPFISVYLDIEDVGTIHDFLSEHLDEEDLELGLIQRLTEFFGF